MARFDDSKNMSVSPASLRLGALPEEILEAIFHLLDAPSLLAASLVNARFHQISEGLLIWRDLTLRSFRFWDGSHEIVKRQNDPSFNDWKGLYAVRHTANIATTNAVKAIIRDPIGRLTRMQSVLGHGYGIKDALLKAVKDADGTDYVLAQRWASHTLLGCINRAVALETLTRVRYRSDVKNPTETALAALDMFILGSDSEGDINDTFHRLDQTVAAVLEAYPDIDQQAPRTRAITIAEYLRNKGWVGIDDPEDHFRLEEQFIGIALRSSNRNSLPLISCVIYCYVCRAFDLQAQPCSFPGRIHAVVQPTLSNPPIDLDGQPLPSHLAAQYEQTQEESDGIERPAPIPSDITHLYMDIFNTHLPTTIADLNSLLPEYAPGTTRAQRATFLLPASPRSLLIRTSHNIINSIRHGTMPQYPNNAPTPSLTIADEHNRPLTIDVYDAAYAALYIHVLFPSSAATLPHHLDDLRAHFAHHFREDLANYETYILPLLASVGYAMGPTRDFGGAGTGAIGARGVGDPVIRDIRNEDLMTPEIKVRRKRDEFQETAAEVVMYRVGTVFRHRRQGYVGVVYGWDEKCEMGERWIMGNGVDGLPQGRGQAFYNVYVEDKSHRYVAQENIIPLKPEEFTAQDAERTFDVQVGRWFKRFDGETGRFVSNVRHEYPED